MLVQPILGCESLCPRPLISFAGEVIPKIPTVVSLSAPVRGNNWLTCLSAMLDERYRQKREKRRW